MERERLILSNRAVYTLIVFGIIIIFGIGTYAYEPYMGSGNASVMGHVAGEINVQNWSKDIVTLQNIVDDYARQIISLNKSLSTTGLTNQLGGPLVYRCPIFSEDANFGVIAGNSAQRGTTSSTCSGQLTTDSTCKYNYNILGDYDMYTGQQGTTTKSCTVIGRLMII